MSRHACDVGIFQLHTSPIHFEAEREREKRTGRTITTRASSFIRHYFFLDIKKLNIENICKFCVQSNMTWRDLGVYSFDYICCVF